MSKNQMITVAITAVVVLIAANKLRQLPLVNKLPTV
jgi:hypothetical protein